MSLERREGSLEMRVNLEMEVLPGDSARDVDAPTSQLAQQRLLFGDPSYAFFPYPCAAFQNDRLRREIEKN